MCDGAALEFTRIHADYRDRVIAHAAMLLGRDQAEDVAQAVFLKVSRSLGSLSDPSKLTAWIFAITLNTVRDVARRNAARVAVAAAPAVPTGGTEGDPPSDPLAQVPDPGHSPEENAARSEMVACYLEFVNQLPRGQYEVYVLSEFGDLTNAAIARQLSLPLGTIKMRLHRARARLYAMVRRHCSCYFNERGELMAGPSATSPPGQVRKGASARHR